jgi:very-short-patch-repair endonuclease
MSKRNIIRNLAEFQKELAKKGELLDKGNTCTFSENSLGQRLIAENIKIVPQWTVGNHSFDFKLLQFAILIEVDGGIHNYRKVRHKDYIKDRYAQRCGFKVLRFSNYEVTHSIQNIMDEIRATIKTVKKQPLLVFIYKYTLKEQIIDFFKSIFKKESVTENNNNHR